MHSNAFIWISESRCKVRNPLATLLIFLTNFCIQGELPWSNGETNFIKWLENKGKAKVDPKSTTYNGLRQSFEIEKRTDAGRLIFPKNQFLQEILSICENLKFDERPPYSKIEGIFMPKSGGFHDFFFQIFLTIQPWKTQKIGIQIYNGMNTTTNSLILFRKKIQMEIS